MIECVTTTRLVGFSLRRHDERSDLENANVTRDLESITTLSGNAPVVAMVQAAEA